MCTLCMISVYLKHTTAVLQLRVVHFVARAFTAAMTHDSVVYDSVVYVPFHAEVLAT